MLSAVTRAATAEVDPAETTTIPRVGYMVYRVERRLRARLDEELCRHGVSTPEYVTLSLLRERDGLSCAQLARSVDRIEADMLGDLPPETVEVVRAALGSFAHSLQATNPPPRPRPLRPRGAAQ
jgi:hypothetical protein